ncbi:MAG: hypothetical protein RIS44_1006 [Pseudomonadota bacterium]
MKLNSRICCVVRGLTASAAMFAGLAQAAPPTWLPSAELPEGTVLLQVEELKAIYLQCDRLSSNTFLDSSTAAHCSLASERLRRVGFDGRGEDVLSWWKVLSQEHRTAAPSGRSASPNGLASL